MKNPENKLDLSDLQKYSHQSCLEKIAKWLPGDYNSFLQAESDQQMKKSNPHRKVLMRIKAVRVQELKEWGHSFYLEQAVESYEDQPYRQRIYLLALNQNGQVINRIFTIDDPSEFIGAWKNPEQLEEKLSLERLKDTKGCDVVWTPLGADRYYGVSGENGSCRTSYGGATHIIVKAWLSQSHLQTFDQGFNDDGRLIFGPTEEEGPYIFTKQTQL